MNILLVASLLYKTYKGFVKTLDGEKYFILLVSGKFYETISEQANH